MLIRPVRDEERELYNATVEHPLQSWEWGEFRKKTGLAVERLGFYDNGKLVKALQVTFHPIPIINRTAGYYPKGVMPDEDQLAALRQIGKQHAALFIKLEPNIAQPAGSISAFKSIADFLTKNEAEPGRPLFTKYTFHLDLTPSEEKLFENLASKTRYNVRLAQKKGVQIYENSTAEGMEQYLTVLSETTKRQGFYAHTPEYFRTMWTQLGGTGMLRIFNAVYEDKILASWVLFVFNNVLYYPYGASSNSHREVMASNLLMWEVIRVGKSLGCTRFDMWGSLGPNPNPKHAWYGFHRFKEGYGGILTEFLGTFDLVLDYPMYKIYRLAEDWRWKLLRLRAKLPF